MTAAASFRHLTFLHPRPVSENLLAEAASLLEDAMVPGWWRLYQDCVEWSLLAPLSRRQAVHDGLRSKLGAMVVLDRSTDADVVAFHRGHRSLRRLPELTLTRQDALSRPFPALILAGIDILGVLTGKACAPEGLGRRCDVQVTAGGITFPPVRADGLAFDLLRRGHRDGLCRFSLQLPFALLTGGPLEVTASVVGAPKVRHAVATLQTPLLPRAPERPWAMRPGGDPVQSAVRALAESTDLDARETIKDHLRHLVRQTPALFLRDLGIEADVLGRGGMWPTYRERLQTRPVRPDVQHINDSKVAMKAYVRERGHPLPQVFQSSGDPDVILQTVRGLGDCVIKPENGSLSRGCILLQDGVDLISRRPMTPDDVAVHLAKLRAARPGTVFIVEELLRPAAGTLGVIPPDYRFYVFGGEVALIYVTDLNVLHPGVLRPTQLAHYTSDWTPSLFPMRVGYRETCDFSPPASLGQMCAMARDIGRDCQTHLRVDMYDTDKGAVLGEVTLYPSAGLRFNVYGEAMLTQAWELFPDIGPVGS